MAETQAQPTTTTTTVDAEENLLEKIIGETKPRDAEQRQRTTEFIQTVIDEALARSKAGGKVIARDVENTIKCWQAEIDAKITAQLNVVLHNPEYQKLEGTYRGLKYLTSESETGTALKIKVLNVTKKVLQKDLDKAAEFDQSILFKKVYEAEYGQLGGQPYGLLLGDYEFNNHPSEDMGLLQKLAGVAAASHAPFVASAGPGIFGLDSYDKLNQPRDLAKIFDSVEYAKWQSFRKEPDSRYVALTLPRVLARLPYGPATKRVEEFNFEEDCDGTDHNKYQWMSPAWAYAVRCTAAFAKDGWFMRTRGVEGGGKVENLPVHTFKVDGGATMKCPTEVLIPDRRENELSELGFLPLLHCKNTDFAAFLGTQTSNKPTKYFDPGANANAELSAKFNYMLCVSRFAHYLKVIARDKIGSFMEVDACQRWLNDWINNYTLADPSLAGEEMLARHPLREASITVSEVKGKPGWYQAVAHLRPHFQLEGLEASMRLVAEVPKKKG